MKLKFTWTQFSSYNIIQFILCNFWCISPYWKFSMNTSNLIPMNDVKIKNIWTCFFSIDLKKQIRSITMTKYKIRLLRCFVPMKSLKEWKITLMWVVASGSNICNKIDHHYVGIFFVTCHHLNKLPIWFLPFLTNCINHGDHGHNGQGRANFSIHTSFNMGWDMFMHCFFRKSRCQYNILVLKKRSWFVIVWNIILLLIIVMLIFLPFFLIRCHMYPSTPPRRPTYPVLMGAFNCFFIFLHQLTNCCLPK